MVFYGWIKQNYLRFFNFQIGLDPLFIDWLIDWLIAVLGLHFCARALPSCGKRGPLFIAVRGPLTVVASLVAEHRLQTRRLSNCGSQAQPLCGMWDLPRPGLEPASPALAGRFSTTAPPGKPPLTYFLRTVFNVIMEIEKMLDVFVFRLNSYIHDIICICKVA